MLIRTGIRRKRLSKTHLIDKKGGDKFSWLEDFNNPPDKIVVRRLGEVGFETDVGELRFRGDVNSPVCSLGGRGRGRDKQKSRHVGAQRPQESCLKGARLTSAFIPFIEYPQGLNIVASITEPGIRSQIPLICDRKRHSSNLGWSQETKQVFHPPPPQALGQVLHE